MATKITAADASRIFQQYHGSTSQPKLKNGNGDVIQGFIIEDADYKHLKAKAGTGFAGVMAVPGHNALSDTIILVGLRSISGKYELVLPPDNVDDSFIIDHIENYPPPADNTNFANLELPDWGC